MAPLSSAMLFFHPRHRIRLTIAFLISSAVIWLSVPYDNGAVLLVRWHAENLKYYYKNSLGAHGKHAHPAGAFPVDVSEVGMVIKTGFATRERLRARLGRLGDGWNFGVDGNVVVAGDYASRRERGVVDGDGVEVFDVLEGLMDEEGIEGNESRVLLYERFQKAIKDTPNDIPEDLSGIGWELDILKVLCLPCSTSFSISVKKTYLHISKHIPALELLYREFPHKKWYMMTDDDTYIHTPSLLSVLSTLPPNHAHYIGNAIGAYTCRFAHGGCKKKTSRF